MHFGVRTLLCQLLLMFWHKRDGCWDFLGGWFTVYLAPFAQRRWWSIELAFNDGNTIGANMLFTSQDMEKLTWFSQIWNDMYHLREGSVGMGCFIEYGLGHGESFVHFINMLIILLLLNSFCNSNKVAS